MGVEEGCADGEAVVMDRRCCGNEVDGIERRPRLTLTPGRDCLELGRRDRHIGEGGSRSERMDERVGWVGVWRQDRRKEATRGLDVKFMASDGRWRNRLRLLCL